jgi:hypothetical protein
MSEVAVTNAQDLSAGEVNGTDYYYRGIVSNES